MNFTTFLSIPKKKLDFNKATTESIITIYTDSYGLCYGMCIFYVDEEHSSEEKSVYGSEQINRKNCLHYEGRI